MVETLPQHEERPLTPEWEKTGTSQVRRVLDLYYFNIISNSLKDFNGKNAGDKMVTK